MAKLIYFDFRCTSCGLKFDDLVPSDTESIPCTDCGEDATRCISVVRFDPKMGLDPDFATFGADWEKKNRQKTQQDKKFYEEHGTDKKHHSYGS